MKRDVFETIADKCAGYNDELYKELLSKYDDALPDETDNQKSCPYCHGAGNLNDTTDRNNDFQIKIDMYDPDDARLNVEYQGGTDYEIVPINYCPMCGRDLHV